MVHLLLNLLSIRYPGFLAKVSTLYSVPLYLSFSIFIEVIDGGRRIFCKGAFLCMYVGRADGSA
jgi:hypothetical protein